MVTNTSELKVKLHIEESVFGPTNITDTLTSTIVPATVLIHKEIIKSGDVDRLTNMGEYSATRDTYVYINNTSNATFDVRSASADAGIFGKLMPNDFLFVRMIKGLDVYVKNLSNHEGTVNVSYWQAENSR